MIQQLRTATARARISASIDIARLGEHHAETLDDSSAFAYILDERQVGEA